MRPSRWSPHGLITGALFLISGSILARGGTYEIDAYGGLLTRARSLTGLTALLAFASLGLPGLAGFVAEVQIFAGTLAIYPALAAVALLGIVLTAALFLRMLGRMFLGTLPERWREFADLGRTEAAALGALAGFVLLIGVVPAWLLGRRRFVRRAVRRSALTAGRVPDRHGSGER